jgi:hypothetical protein
MTETERLWAALEILTKAVGDLFDFSMSQAKDQKALVPLQRFLKQHGALLKMLGEKREERDGSSDIGELLDRLGVLEEAHAEREADAKRPVHVTLVRSAANE